MRGIWTTAGLVAAMVAIGAPAVAAPPDRPEREGLRFLDVSRQVGSPADDVLQFDNLLRDVSTSDAITRQVLGRFPSTCTPTGGTVYRCEGRLVLRDGTIEVTGTPDLAVTPIDMVVTGGTGRYAAVSGSARLTPTGDPGRSVLDVTLVRPAS